MAVLNDLADLLNSGGAHMPGLEMSHDEAIRLTRKHFHWFEYCIVRDWTWVDLDVTPEQQAQLTKTQRQPAIILARTVIYDSSRRYDVGDLVRTSPLYKYKENFIFATLNRAYILLGDGVRKRATLETVAKLY